MNDLLNVLNVTVSISLFLFPVFELLLLSELSCKELESQIQSAVFNSLFSPI